MTVTEQPSPDPGNSDPDAWTTDLTEVEEYVAYRTVNNIAVDLPEPEGVEQ